MTDTSEPAFPLMIRMSPVPGPNPDAPEEINFLSCPGMSLRDYFAAKAMQAFGLSEAKPDIIARWAYEHADAMLAERDKGKESS